ncbi:MAG: Bax inhibitor-1/YccA family protein [Ignavibacteria bacterium]|nr:Bax inhibitor-1/YccA family protein [Ignavibacteria bacterium]
MKPDLSSFESPTLSLALQGYIRKTYLWMVGGLLISGFTAWFTVNTPFFGLFILNPVILFILFFAELGLVWFLSSRIMSIEISTASFLFVLYSFLNGLTLSLIFFVYASTTIQNVFFTTAALFAAMSFYGYTTKRDLTSWGSFLFMGLIGIVIAIIINMFIGSSALDFAISLIGVLIFVGLTAYDTQKIKEMFYELSENEMALGKYSILAALTLYLDFINLFLFLLRLFGRRE